LVQADGNDVEPVTIDEFRIANAETYDVIVQPRDASVYTIFAQAADRSGYARATLAPRMGMEAPVPSMDPRPTRTMADMGMAGMSDKSDLSDISDKSDMSEMPGMDMGKEKSPKPTTSGSVPQHEMAGMQMS